ncbi:MAG: hypothetical protein ABL311_07615 [Nitratireductor rhodophyticola]
MENLRALVFDVPGMKPTDVCMVAARNDDPGAGRVLRAQDDLCFLAMGAW